MRGSTSSQVATPQTLAITGRDDGDRLALISTESSSLRFGSSFCCIASMATGMIRSEIGLFVLLRFEHELRQGTGLRDRPCLILYVPSFCFTGCRVLPRVRDVVDHVPDQLALHLAAGLRHVDPHHAHRLERELQAPDVAAEDRVRGHLAQRLRVGSVLGVQLRSGMPCRISTMSCVRDRFLFLPVGRNRHFDARSQRETARAWPVHRESARQPGAPSPPTRRLPRRPTSAMRELPRPKTLAMEGAEA